MFHSKAELKSRLKNPNFWSHKMWLKNEIWSKFALIGSATNIIRCYYREKKLNVSYCCVEFKSVIFLSKLFVDELLVWCFDSNIHVKLTTTHHLQMHCTWNVFNQKKPFFLFLSFFFFFCFFYFCSIFGWKNTWNTWNSNMQATSLLMISWKHSSALSTKSNVNSVAATKWHTKNNEPI